VLDFGANKADTPDYRMYISGDTLVYDDLKHSAALPRHRPGPAAPGRHPHPGRVQGDDGRQGRRPADADHPAEEAIPIHYNDYDVFKSPLADFAREVKAAGLEQQVVYLAHGETYTFTPRKR
jgi:L-ascorbate metabolism protein UlaG (beta-lactamase superfamily)